MASLATKPHNDIEGKNQIGSKDQEGDSFLKKSNRFLKFIDETIEQLKSHEDKVEKKKSREKSETKSLFEVKQERKKNVFSTRSPLLNKKFMSTRGSCFSVSPPEFKKELTQADTVKLSAATTNHRRMKSATHLDWDLMLKKRQKDNITVTPENLIEENAKLKLQLLKKNQEFDTIFSKFQQADEKSWMLKEKNKNLEIKLAKLVLLEGLSERNSFKKESNLESLDSSGKFGKTGKEFLASRDSVNDRNEDLMKQSLTMFIKNQSSASSKGPSHQNSQILMNFGMDGHQFSEKLRKHAQNNRIKADSISGIVKGLFQSSSKPNKEMLLKKSRLAQNKNQILWGVRNSSKHLHRENKPNLFQAHGSIEQNPTESLPNSPIPTEVKAVQRDHSALNAKIRPSLNSFLKSR